MTGGTNLGPTETSAGLTWRAGTVERLNKHAEFGYVLEAATGRRYIFVFGFALKRAEGGRLRAGQAVRFQMAERGRVVSLRGVA